MKFLLLTLTILLFSGCDSDEETLPPRVATDGALMSSLFTDVCTNVPTYNYDTQADTHTYFKDIAGQPVYWDNRYTVDKTTVDCNNGLVFSTAIDTRTTNGNVVFGGPNSTLVYRFQDKHFPWKNKTNLMMQVEFDSNSYENLDTNNGGTVCFNFFARNVNTGHRINYVINIFSYGQGRTYEVDKVLYDPSTDTHFINSVLKPGTEYTTLSDISNIINDDNGLFRVNVSAANFNKALQDMEGDNGTAEDWYLTFIGMQFELEEEKGNGLLDGKFRKFKSYITTSPM